MIFRNKSKREPPEGRAYTEAEKDAILSRIRKVWVAHPELRLGQLLKNAQIHFDVDMYNVEDEELAHFLEEFQRIVVEGLL